MWGAITAAVIMAGLVWMTRRTCTMLERRAVSREELDQRWCQEEAALDHIEGRMDELKRANEEHATRLDAAEANRAMDGDELAALIERMGKAESQVAQVQTKQALTPQRRR